jgi:peroxiredoxin Q/BCP
MKVSEPMKTIARIAATATTLIVATCASAEPLEIGAAIPAVSQKNHEGKEIALAEVGAKGYLLVYFYPKADTPGCTKQACSIRDAYESLVDKGVKAYGVSLDKVEDQKAFHEKYKLPFDLIADADGKIADAFGVPHTGGFAKRQAFLFHEGKLVWRDLNASTDQQAADVIKVIETK